MGDNECQVSREVEADQLVLARAWILHGRWAG
jgi:hypothetical protein